MDDLFEQLHSDHADAMRWAMPREFGGDELEPLELHLRYEQLARKSLGLALVLTQRDSAVGILAVANCRPLLDEVRQGAFVMVGIAQLTTSRQGAAPALVWNDDGLTGLIPWATGAAKAKYVIAGASAAGGQVLVALRTDSPGVTVEPPMQLVALSETLTSTIRCQNVRIEHLLLGPAANVLAQRRKGVAIPQAFLALGHCRGALDLIAQHDSDRGRALRERFSSQIDDLHGRIGTWDPVQIPLLRGQCNDLALRITHAAVALYKGTGLLLSHPAQRLAREAMFLLVWSCPDPVIDCTVDLLSEPP